MDRIELAKAEYFLIEYEKLCKKHGRGINTLPFEANYDLKGGRVLVNNKPFQKYIFEQKKALDSEVSNGGRL